MKIPKITALALLVFCTACAAVPPATQNNTAQASKTITQPQPSAEIAFVKEQDQIIVSFNPGIGQEEKIALLSQLGIQGTLEFRGNYDLLSLKSGLVDALRALNGHDSVKYAEPNSRYRAH